MGQIEGVMRDEIMGTLKHLKILKAPGSSRVYVGLILIGGDVGISVDRILPQNIR